MALKALLLRKKIDDKKKTLEKLRQKDAEFTTREAELTAALEEVTEETPEEDRQIVEDNIAAFDEEKQEHEDSKRKLSEEIEGLEAELAEEEKRQEPPAPGKDERKKGEIKTMENRTKFFDMSIQERDAFLADENVRTFLGEVRTCIKEKRALSNVGLTIPEIALPLIRQIASENSKLVKYVTLRSVSGTTRQNIMGEIPEAFWDEMCAAIKELDLTFYNTEMDGYKVSGFFAVCNAILEDSDINLAYELLNAIGKAIGKALDKAILYGKGVKMPMGVVTSLTKTEAPAGYPTTGREWEDLTLSHVITGTQASGVKLFQEIVKNSGIVDNDYDTDNLVWVMNKKTRTTLLAESIGVNSSAAIVAGTGKTMPVVGGDIVDFSYIPDNTIIFGYFSTYVLAERAETKLGQSEHVKFLDDQTVFRGTARYDGKPVIREAFAIFGIGGAPDTTAPKFAGEATE